MEFLLLPIGLACIGTSILHGYLGQTRIIDQAEFPRGWGRGLVTVIWHYSTATWAAIGAFIAASPWLLTDADRYWMIPTACAPIVYCIVGNAIVTKARHFGWIVLTVIVVTACLVAQL